MPALEQSEFGRLADGTAVEQFILRNDRGITAKLITLGAILTDLQVPDRAGTPASVVTGFDNLESYAKGHPFFGAIAGRVANRIGGAKFTLDGKEYVLAANNGVNHLHGGRKGFDKVVWKVKSTAQGPDSASVTFSHFSPDGDEGYPGGLTVLVTYSLNDAGELRIDYSATTDKPTIINLTNHSYFNLAGSGDILSHELQIYANQYTPVDEGLIPTGQISPVEGTPLDFRAAHKIGERIDQLKPRPGGYDHNYVLDHGGKSLGLAALVHEPVSGRVMEVRTTEPGMQLYTGNNLDGKHTGHGGAVYNRHCSFCLETQHYPDSIHHANFPSTVLRPGQEYATTTIYQFSTR